MSLPPIVTEGGMERCIGFRLALLFLPFFVAFLAVSLYGKVGDIAEGEIIAEDAKSLTLRSDPCDSGSPIITFSAPWKKRHLEKKKKCSDNSIHDVFQIEQLPAPPQGGQGNAASNPEERETNPPVEDTAPPPK